MLQTRRLYQFLAIANSNSITKAAEQIGITQPALTRSLKQLENELSVALVERRPGGIVLTPAGKILARRVKLMNLEYQHALAEISEWTLGARGRLNIAAGPAWIGWILPPVIAEFQSVYPDVRVTLTGGGVELQLEQLLSGEVDVVCGPVDFPAHAELVSEPLTRLRHSIVAREGHPLANRHTVPPREIAGYSWVILTNDPFSSSRVGAYFVANGLEPPRVVMETNAFGALSMVRCSDLLTSFASVAEPVLKQLSLAVIRQQGTFWDFEAGLTRLKATRPSGPLNGFRTILRGHLADAE